MSCTSCGTGGSSGFSGSSGMGSSAFAYNALSSTNCGDATACCSSNICPPCPPTAGDSLAIIGTGISAVLYAYHYLVQNPNGRVHMFYENLDNTDIPNIGDLDFPLSRLNNSNFVDILPILHNRNGIENSVTSLITIPTTAPVGDSLIANYPRFLEWVPMNARLYSARKESLLHNYSSTRCLSALELQIAQTLASFWGICLTRNSFIEKPAIYAMHRFFTTSGDTSCCYDSTTCATNQPILTGVNPAAAQFASYTGNNVGQIPNMGFIAPNNFNGECDDSFGPNAVKPARHLLVDFKNRVFNSSRTTIYPTVTNWVRAQQAGNGSWSLQFQQGGDAIQTVTANKLLFKTNPYATSRIASQLRIPNFAQLGIPTDGNHPRAMPTFSDYRAVLSIPALSEVISGALTLPGVRDDSNGLLPNHLQWMVRYTTTNYDPYTKRTAAQGQNLLIVNGVNMANRRSLQWSRAKNSFVSNFNSPDVEYKFLCAFAYIVRIIRYAITGINQCVNIVEQSNTPGGVVDTQVLFDNATHLDGILQLLTVCGCLFSDSLSCTDGR